MAKKTDEVDRERARQFAWRRPSTEGPVERVELPDVEDEARSAHVKLRVARVCQALSRRIAAILALPADTRERLAAEDALFASVAGLDFELVGLQNRPDGPRLVRLYLAAGPRMPRDQRRRVLVALLRWLLDRLDLANDPDLLVDAVRAVDFDVVVALARDCGSLPARAMARVGAALAGLLSSGSPPQRSLAAVLLAARAFPGTIAPLREALRSRDLDLRVNALEGLLLCEDGLREEDVTYLVEDVVEYGPRVSRGNEVDGAAAPELLDVAYEKLLLEAVARVRPASAIPAAERLAWRGEFAFPHRGFERWFGRALLALLAPERVLAAIDAGLAVRFDVERLEAVAAAAFLPEALARPRLERAADDRLARIAAKARRAWSDRFGGDCPAPRTVGRLAALLDGPPSAGFALRLKLLEGPADGAGALALALLREAPSTEALVLLVHALFARGHDWPDREGLPRGDGEWDAVLVRHFPPAAVVRALLLAQREASTAFVASARLLGLAECGAIPAELVDEVRDGCIAALETGHVYALKTLGVLGARAQDWSAIWPRALCAPGFEHEVDMQASAAREALAGIGRCPGLNDAIVRALASPVRADAHLADLAELALARRLRRAVPILLALLESYDDGREWDAFLRIARALHAAGHLDERWIRGHLRHPDRPIFGVAAWIESPAFLRGAKPLLLRALQSDARGGRAAVEALWPLVAIGDLRASDPLVESTLATAPESALVWFFALMRERHCTTSGYEVPLVRLLVSDDARHAEFAYDELCREADGDERAVAASALDLVKHDALREQIARDARGEPDPWEQGPAIQSLFSDEGSDGADEADEADDDADA